MLKISTFVFFFFMLLTTGCLPELGDECVSTADCEAGTCNSGVCLLYHENILDAIYVEDGNTDDHMSIDFQDDGVADIIIIRDGDISTTDAETPVELDAGRDAEVSDFGTHDLGLPDEGVSPDVDAEIHDLDTSPTDASWDAMVDHQDADLDAGNIIDANLSDTGIDATSTDATVDAGELPDRPNMGNPDDASAPDEGVDAENEDANVLPDVGLDDAEADALIPDAFVPDAGDNCEGEIDNAPSLCVPDAALQCAAQGETTCSSGELVCNTCHKYPGECSRVRTDGRAYVITYDELGRKHEEQNITNVFALSRYVYEENSRCPVTILEIKVSDGTQLNSIDVTCDDLGRISRLDWTNYINGEPNIREFTYGDDGILNQTTDYRNGAFAGNLCFAHDSAGNITAEFSCADSQVGRSTYHYEQCW